MAKITEYPVTTEIANDDVLLVDGAGGTRGLSVSGFSEAVANNIIGSTAITGLVADIKADIQEKGDEVIDSIPSDYTALQGEVSDLKSDLNNSANLYIYEQPTITKNSGLLPLPVQNGDSITIERIDGQTFQNSVQLRFYDANKTYITYVATTPADATIRTTTVNLPSDCSYIGITDVGSVSGEYRVTNNSSKSVILQEINARKSEDAAIRTALEVLDTQTAKKSPINRFNKATITEGKYISQNTGNLADGTNFFASDFIYIGDLSTVTVSNTHIVIWADENKAWMGHPDQMNSGANDITYDIPTGAKYIRFSAYNTNLDSAQVGENINRNNYVPYGAYTLPGLRINSDQINTLSNKIVVASDGSGDYTSFTLACLENYDNNKDIVVKPGTYDIVAEYVAIWGQEAVDNMADSDSATFDGWQYGVKMNGRKFVFLSGAKLVCDWTGHTVDGTHRFSALRVEMDVDIEGLDLDCTATFYCVHDDYGNNTTPYTVKYKNCRIVGHNITNVNCIGGGCKKWSRHILDNCYLDNNTTVSTAVRYHNTNVDGAVPEVYVSNCYFGTYFRVNWYGTQTSKMRVYVNNCHAKRIYKDAETSSAVVDNIELYKWNNEETDM